MINTLLSQNESGSAETKRSFESLENKGLRGAKKKTEKIGVRTRIRDKEGVLPTT